MGITAKELDIWCREQYEEQISLLRTLAAIPAPSHNEKARAEFIRDWLLSIGAENVMLDDAWNVIVPFCCSDKEPFLLCTAHTDVVFPDTTPLPVRVENGKLYAPGVGDDTANVVAMMLCIKFLITHPGVYTQPTLFVFDSCEEGLGNLKGIRAIMEAYSGRIREMVSFDLQWESIISRAVGSERWKIEMFTNGGHSYGDFGNENAIHRMSELVCLLYRQTVPQKENTKTTYNVGLISGGTSVNTIAQSASITYEYRSDDLECLERMAQQFQQILEHFKSDNTDLSVKAIGKRPCGMDIPREKQEALISRCRNAVKKVTGTEPLLCSGSTDANIPLSLGIPAVTFGLYRGAGAHTRQEYVELDSLVPGLKIALVFLLQENLAD